MPPAPARPRSRPAIAAAAAIGGLTRCVRPPRPCRPSKLRFDVDAHRSPGARTSGFMPRHIEQPARRHSKPGVEEDLVEPLLLGLALHRRRAGDDHRAHAVGDAPPGDDRAAARRSSIRAFVHEPMKTRSTRISASGVPGLEAHVARARARPPRARAGVVVVRRVGNDAVDRRDHPGVRPPRDLRRAAPRRRRRRSRSNARVRVGAQLAPAVERLLPGGAARRGRAALEVGERRVVRRDHPGARAGLDRHVADRHPALHRERPDERARVLEHVAGAARDAEPADRAEDEVLRGQPERKLAVEADAHRLAACAAAASASRARARPPTCRSPNASAPKAPCVEVWLSPQTTSSPAASGRARARSRGRSPRARCPSRRRRMPNSVAVAR